tara:strand:+ start:8179 stop:8391 length:213 start_codon:yes stop_codon:yes gene_type:complete
MSQLSDVLEYMQTKGSITSMDAIEMFGATRMSAIIYDIKKKGYNVESPLIPVKNRYGKTVYVSSYSLEKK